MFEAILITALVLFALAIGIAAYRIIKGPSMPDRVVALDVIGVNLISVAAVVSIVLDTRAFLEVILIVGILAFISTIAFSKFIERGSSLNASATGEMVGAILILAGAIMAVVSAIGVIRLPDVYTRSHAGQRVQH
ncbi:Na(+) H(+) antiporter subunit F [Bacillus sp. JCM 19046]|nr:Na(+) H(+) antiporter subunit F [Bacillus sp. JCM 19046]